jgi:energy-coupling factor transport system permease protein
VSAALCVQLAPSPVYVALVIGVAALIVEVHAPAGPFQRAFPLLVLAGTIFALIRIVLTVLTTHNGIDVLFTVPQVHMPKLLGDFTVGGSIELPVILQAAAVGFTIVGLMAVFGAFNAVASHYELVQSSPRAFYELGVVTTVAVAFVPFTFEAIGAVREADRARTGGRVVRRGRLLRLLVPLLERGMERAVLLAESMDARGFAHAGSTSRDRAAGWCSLAALLSLGGAFVALVDRASVLALAFGLVGAALVVGAVVLASSESVRRRYRPRRMSSADWTMAAVCGVAPLAVGIAALTGNGTLTWVASPLDWPRFDPLVVLALVPLLAPLARRPDPLAVLALSGGVVREPMVEAA